MLASARVLLRIFALLTAHLAQTAQPAMHAKETISYSIQCVTPLSLHKHTARIIFAQLATVLAKHVQEQVLQNAPAVMSPQISSIRTNAMQCSNLQRIALIMNAGIVPVPA